MIIWILWIEYGYIYLTRLDEKDEIIKEYGTTIDLSVLIHELGHAIASQIKEYVQDESGNFVMNTGMANFQNYVDRENRTVETGNGHGLYVEEAINSIEEVRILKRILNVEDLKQVPGYAPSDYQGLMVEIMKLYIKEIGERPFFEYRIMKNREVFKDYQDIISRNEIYQKIGSREYEEKKKDKIYTEIKTLDDVDEERKQEIIDFFETYKDVYFPRNLKGDFMERLNNCFEEIYNLKEIRKKIKFISTNKETPIKNEKNFEIFDNIKKIITAEGCAAIIGIRTCKMATKKQFETKEEQIEDER